MTTLILILLLLAAAFGVLGAVLKVALVLVLAFALAVVVAAWAGVWWLRSRLRAVERELLRRAREEERRRNAVDIRRGRNEARGDPPALGGR